MHTQILYNQEDLAGRCEFVLLLLWISLSKINEFSTS